MKVLLTNHFPQKGSGSGVYVENIAKSLAKRGHEVCIIMSENTTKIKKIKNVKIHPVYFKKDEIISGQVEFNFPCMDPHPRSNFLFHNMNEEQRNQYERAFRNAIEEEINEFKPDIIHAQHIWVIPGILSDYDIPYIITSHGAEFITYQKTDVFDKYGFKAVEKCKKIINISQDNKNEIISKFPKAENKIIFIKNGYNSHDFYIENIDKNEILKKYSISKQYNKIVLFVGRITKLKGLDTLFNAAKIYEKEDVLTLIAGDGAYLEELKHLKEELNLKNIIFLGNKEQEELRELYNIADVLVLPSRKEALPLVAIEAFACGTPAIISNLPGIQEIVKEDVGYIFEMDNAEMLAEKINLIIDKKVIFDKKKITNYAKENYSEEALINSLISVYEECCKE